MNIHEAFIALRDAVGIHGHYDYEDRFLTGSTPISPEITEALQTLDDSADLPELCVNGAACATKAIPTTGTVEFKARAPKTYFEDLPDLIRRHPFSPPPGFTIYSIADENKHELYLAASKLAELLMLLCATKDHKHCVIFAKDKLDIPFSYSVSDLRPIPTLDEIYGLMNPAISSPAEPARIIATYHSLFKEALFDVISKVAQERRFAYLIEHFQECVFRFRLAFRLFSEEANAIIERYEEKRAGMISALNGVLGNIQTSLIGIPLAGLLALKEIKVNEGFSFGNIVIVIAVVTVAVLLFILTLSQGKTLSALTIHHEQLRKEIEASGGGATKIDVALNAMGSHQQFLVNLLVAVRVIIVMFALVALATLFWHSVFPATNPGTPSGSNQTQVTGS